MAEDEDKSNKTEEPTDQKLRKAREKGDVPSSQEAGSAMVVFALFMVVAFILPQVFRDFARSAATFIEMAPKNGGGSTNENPVTALYAFYSLIKSLSLDIAPIFLAMVVATLIGVLLQGETVVAMDRIVPKPEKLSPLGGLKKMFSVDRAVEFLKNVTKVAIVAAIAYVVASEAISDIWTMEQFVPETLLLYISTVAKKLLLFVAIFLIPIALFDIIWKRLQWIKKQRMTVQEIRDEHKDMEGDPKIKSQRAELRRKRANQRIATAVPTASVIITNPTHYAVALKYEMGVDVAPVCVAKGVDLMAKKIRELASDHDIPIIENKTLARALYATVEVDDQIPAEHWQVIAEIIGYVMDLRRNIRRRPPAGSALYQET
ncbi:MAG: flagellar biosynthesis protein FlhB [Rhodobacteraceae bacterium]|nr:flagellar biosynthesis protein FlhB [Paracoccaceae bacterium]